MNRAKNDHTGSKAQRESFYPMGNTLPEEAFYEQIFSDEELAAYLGEEKPLLVYELAQCRYILNNVLDSLCRDDLSEEVMRDRRSLLYYGLNTIDIIRSKGVKETILDWEPLRRKVAQVLEGQGSNKHGKGGDY